MACESSWIKDQTCATATARAAAVLIFMVALSDSKIIYVRDVKCSLQEDQNIPLHQYGYSRKNFMTNL